VRPAAAWCVAGVLVVSSITGAVPATGQDAGAAAEGKLDPAVRRALARAPPDATLRVIVSLRREADLEGIEAPGRPALLRGVVGELRETARRAQGQILRFLQARRAQGLVRRVRPFWVFNGLAVAAAPSVIEELAGLHQVESIRPDTVVPAPIATEASVSASPEANIQLVGAPALWDAGYRGAGVVVANLDTGVDLSHPDLAATWRGGDNSWFDPNGEHPTEPTDVNGHGTWTMGVMAGGAQGGSAIGMAPEAAWIAVKIFDDQDEATVSGIHAGFQWLIDPDGDPATPDAPNVVNASWTFGSPGCEPEFGPDIQALRAAGILPVFAGGNGGPSGGTSYSPANNPGALSVGATTDADAITSFSSRGPSACESGVTFPDVVAPGLDVRTTDLFNGYAEVSGTSLAAPHVAGGLALLLDAFPGVTADEQEAGLTTSAFDLGSAGPDNAFGDGRLDVIAAYSALEAGGGTGGETSGGGDGTGGGNAGTHPRAGSPPLALSLRAPGRAAAGDLGWIGGEDIVVLDAAGFRLLLDGSDVGLEGLDVVAFAALDPDSFLLSIDRPAVIEGLGMIDDSDVVRFDATSLGDGTSGTFSRYLDGSDVGLSGRSERLDAVDSLPDGRLIVSTTGHLVARGLRAMPQDLTVLRNFLGEQASGRWAIYYDGSRSGLRRGSENVDAAAADAGSVYLSVRGAFAAAGISGAGEDVFLCMGARRDRASGCRDGSRLVLDGGDWELSGVDAVELL